MGSSSVELREDVFRNYLYENTLGALYGLGGGVGAGEYRLNLDQFRLELATNSNTTEIVLEYISDEARSTNPWCTYTQKKLCDATFITRYV